jgi:hypothetical protein
MKCVATRTTIKLATGHLDIGAMDAQYPQEPRRPGPSGEASDLTLETPDSPDLWVTYFTGDTGKPPPRHSTLRAARTSNPAIGVIRPELSGR